MLCALAMSREKRKAEPVSGRDCTYSDLQQYFHLPIVEAARLLNVCPSYLKKVCRRNNILRWPYRKIKSIGKSELAILESEVRFERDCEGDQPQETRRNLLESIQSVLLDADEMNLVKEELVELSTSQTQNYVYKSQSSGEIPFFFQGTTRPVDPTQVIRLGHTRADFFLYESNSRSDVFFTGPVNLAPVTLPQKNTKLRPFFEPDLLNSSTSHFVPFTLVHPRSWAISLDNHTCLLPPQPSSSFSDAAIPPPDSREASETLGIEEPVAQSPRQVREESPNLPQNF
jgi:hypothetical protein